MKIEELDDVDIDRNDSVYGKQIERVNAKRALVGAGARILFYPTLLYNVLRNKMEAEFRWWDEVDQFLLLGAVPFPKDVPRLKLLGVGGVITLNEPYETLVPTSLYYAHGIDHLVEYKNMTPAAALDYVRSRRPRVLLAPSQWKAVQEFSKSRPSTAPCSPSGDAVFITKDDLEGYHGTSDDAGKQLAVVPKVLKASPMIARLSCLFASLKVSGGCGPVVRRLPVPEPRAC